MLKSIKYSVNATGYTDPWNLNEIKFDDFNIIVGVNSTGKSRMLKVINVLAVFIRNPGAYFLGHWSAKFDFNGSIYSYEIICPNDGVISEILLIDNIEVMYRIGDTARVFSQITNSFDFFSPPSNSLVNHFRRDQKAYPYLETLYNWAESVKFFEFGHIHSYELNPLANNKRETISIDNIAKILEENVSSTGKKNIIESMNKLNYKLKGLSTEVVNGVPKIIIHEQGFTNYIKQTSISQGMLRSLALLIFIEYISELKHESLILIDDLAEGLDYKRATLIGDFLNSYASKPLQLIATSNHDFLLNEINIDNWILLYRDLIDVKSISIDKYPELFKKFKMSGLAPFDLFTSSFLKKYFTDENSDIR